MIRSVSRHERRRPAAILLAAAAVAAMSLAGGIARGEEAVRQVLPGAPAAAAPQQLTREKAPDQSEIERFCSNIADAARDRRYALQAEELKQLQAGIDERMKALDAKRPSTRPG